MNQKLSADVANFASTAESLFCNPQHIFLARHAAIAEHTPTLSACFALPQNLNLAQFKHAIKLGLDQANLSVVHKAPQQQLDVQVEVFDFRHLNHSYALERVKNWMHADLEVAASLKPHRALYRHVLFVCHDHIFWYQRYHQLNLNEDCLFELTQNILNLYQELKDPLPLSDCHFPTLKCLVEHDGLS